LPHHSHDDAVLAEVSWPDAELQRLTIDYDAVMLTVRESTGTERFIRCEGYIGYDMCGFWDEVVVERVELTDRHDAIDRCKNELSRRWGANLTDTGNDQRNSRTWQALILHLSDGAALELVAARFSVE
jgi:hypothetical protein